MLFYDTYSLSSITIDKDTGFLNAPIVLTRTGVHKYSGFDLNLPSDRANDIINVYRSPSEVLSKDSLQTYINLVITNNHPSQLVTIDNCKMLQKGTVSNVQQGEKQDSEDCLAGTGTITDPILIEDVQKGKKEVSLGYECDLVPYGKIYNGIFCEFEHKNIKANHLAVVDAGRCGKMCKIGDSLMKEVLFNKKKYMVDTEEGLKALQQALDCEEEKKEKTQKEKDEEEEKEKKELKEKDEELEKVKKEKETDEEKAKKEKEIADAKLDLLKTKTLDENAISTMIDNKVRLRTMAQEILGKDMPDCKSTCDKELKRLVVDRVLKLPDLKDKSETYLDVAFDSAIESFKERKTNFDSLAEDFSTKIKDEKGNEITRESARKKYCADKGLEV